jgi:threonyl-tRNA synthetase
MLFSLAFNKIPMFRSNLLRNKLQKSSKILFSTDTFIPLPTNENNPKLVKIRHTTAHVLAMAVQKLFPDAKLATGPWIENGYCVLTCSCINILINCAIFFLCRFYYDFFFPSRQLSDQNLKSIKKEMDKIIKLNFKISKSILTRDNARYRK